MNDLETLLKENIVIVNFTKTDGSLREMECTLDKNHLPHVESLHESEVKKRKLSDEVIRVFDLQKQEWRSFRKDRVISYHLKG